MIQNIMHLKLARALKDAGGIYELSDILEALDRGDMQSFAHKDSWAITQMCAYPRRKVLEWLFFIGDLDGMRALGPEIADFAREHGATMMRGCGRDGWAALCGQHGWKTVGRVYHKELLS